MAKAETKGFGKPDEVREFPNGRLELVKIGGATVGRATFNLAGNGRRRCSHWLRPKVVRRRTFNITLPA